MKLRGSDLIHFSGWVKGNNEMMGIYCLEINTVYHFFIYLVKKLYSLHAWWQITLIAILHSALSWPRDEYSIIFIVYYRQRLWPNQQGPRKWFFKCQHGSKCAEAYHLVKQKYIEAGFWEIRISIKQFCIYSFSSAYLTLSSKI